MLTFFPFTSSATNPNRRSAVALNDWIIPRSSMITIASGTVARIDSRCASRLFSSSITRRNRASLCRSAS
jgi:hypothetical protein